MKRTIIVVNKPSDPGPGRGSVKVGVKQAIKKTVFDIREGIVMILPKKMKSSAVDNVRFTLWWPIYMEIQDLKIGVE